MGKRTNYAPGVFCWIELGAQDASKAVQFYSSLLGWAIQDIPFEEGTYYSCNIDGAAVAGIYQAPPELSGWMSYVSTPDADLIAKRAQELGGNLLGEPTDVADMGRMAVLQDPHGGTFSAWQPKSMAGAELVNDPGAWTMGQLQTHHPNESRSFYEGLFNWTFTQESDQPPFWSIYVNDSLNAGMLQNSNQSAAPNNWLTFFTSPIPLEDAAIKISAQGGTVIVQPLEIPAGRILVALDSLQNPFGLFEGETDE